MLRLASSSFFIKLLLLYSLFLGSAFAMSGHPPGGWGGGGGASTTLVVDANPTGIFSLTCENTSDDYHTIQDAVNDAEEGDTISICDATYNEKVTISTDRLTIKRSDDADENEDVIVKNSNNVFTIDGVNGLIISTLLLKHTDNKNAIYIKGDSENILIQDTNITSDDGDGIYVKKGIGYIELNNITIDADKYGVYFKKELNDGLTISDSTITTKLESLEFSKNVNGLVSMSNNAFESTDNDCIDFNGKINNGLSISDTNLTALQNAIEIGDNISSDFNISNVHIIAGEKGLEISKKINDGITISNTNIEAEKFGIEVQKEISDKIEITDTNISSENGEALSLNKINDGITLDNLILDSKSYAIKIEDEINDGMELSNSTLTSRNSDAMKIDKKINDGITISDSEINAKNNGFYFKENISGDIDISGISIISGENGIYFKGKINDGIEIKDSDINSTSAKGIYFENDVYDSCTIDNINISSSDRGLYFNEKQIEPTITNSTIVSSDSDAIYTKNNDWSKFTLKDSCVQTNKNGKYALWINNNSTNAEVSGNCFYATAVNKLGKAKKSGNDISGNYWDENSGNYTYNNINDTNTLASCDLNCSEDDNNSGGDTNETTNFKFDAWDTFRNINDRNISTKIVKKDFEVIIASLNDDGSDYQEFNGTVCTKIIDQDNNDLSDWQKIYFNDKNTSDQTTDGNPSFNIDKSSKDNLINIVWKKLVDENCPLLNENNETNATDSFAIRPKKFLFTLPTEVYAGETFTIDFNATNINDANSEDYNETKGNSFEINATIIKEGCNIGTFALANFSFSDGSASSIDTNYTNIGDLNISIQEKDACSDKYASVDCDDKEVTNQWNVDKNLSIEPFSRVLNIKPYELNITKVEMNASTNTDWLYMANVDDMNLSFFAVVQANNKQHDKLDDFNSTCYAEDVNISFGVDVLNGDDNLDMNATIIVNNGTNKSSFLLQDINKTITIKSDYFIAGEGNASYFLNVDRNYSDPVNPFMVKDLNVIILTEDVAKYENNATDDVNVTFYYARLRTKDVQTTSNDVNVSGEIEVYDNNDSSPYIKGFQQNSLYWYRMKKQTTNDEGNVTDVIPTLNSTLDTAEFNVTNIGKVVGGRFTIEISHGDDGQYTMHEKTQEWLWYVPENFGSDYNDSNGSNCSQHPCFYYSHKANKNGVLIGSGTFTGTDFNGSSESNYTRVGVKIFR